MVPGLLSPRFQPRGLYSDHSHRGIYAGDMAQYFGAFDVVFLRRRKAGAYRGDLVGEVIEAQLFHLVRIADPEFRKAVYHCTPDRGVLVRHPRDGAEHEFAGALHESAVGCFGEGLRNEIRTDILLPDLRRVRLILCVPGVRYETVADLGEIKKGLVAFGLTEHDARRRSVASFR